MHFRKEVKTIGRQFGTNNSSMKGVRADADCDQRVGFEMCKYTFLCIELASLQDIHGYPSTTEKEKYHWHTFHKSMHTSIPTSSLFHLQDIE
jgi:uncharacterized protein YaiE (UPF0345 family)